MLAVDEAVRILHPELGEQLRIRAVTVVVAEHQPPPARREVGVVPAERGPMAGEHPVLVPLEVDERVAPVEEDRLEHGPY